MKITLFRILILLASLGGVAGCSEDNAFVGSDIPVDSVVPGVTTNYTLTATTVSPVLIVGSTATITATLMDGDLPVAEAPVTFIVDNGRFSGAVTFTAITNASGIATAVLTAPVLVGSGNVTVSYSDKTATLKLDYIAGPAFYISLDASPSSVGVSSASTLTALLQDQYGNPIVSEAMQFSVSTIGSGLPTISGTGIVQTNSSGIATTTYTSGTVSGTDTITVAPLVGGSPATTKDIVVSTAATQIKSLTLRQELPSTSMTVGNSQALTATVLDDQDAPVAGLDVAFEVVGAGDIAGGKLASGTTDANGVATVTLAAPLLVGNATITASTAGISQSVTLTYIADVPATVTLSASPVTVGVSSDSTLTATIYDQHGNVTPGEPVVYSFATNTSVGTLSPSTGNAVTNTSGVATIVYTSGTIQGTDTLQVKATNGSAPTAQTDIVVSSAASSITSLTLTQEQPTTSMTVGTDQVLTASVLDSNSDPVEGQEVAFVIEGAGSISGAKVAYALTNISGLATVTLDAPVLVGSATIVASSAGLDSSINLTYIADIPATVTLVASPVTVGVSSDSTLTATVYDQYGNVTPDEPVVFSFATGSNISGGTLTPSTGNAITNSSGVSTIIYTSGSSVGTDQLQVDVTNGTTLTRTATVDITVSSSASSIDSLTLVQENPTTSMVTGTTQALIAEVLDINNAPVEGLEVAFVIEGAGSIGGAKVQYATTNASGVATVNLTAPLMVGSATITASSAGLNSNIALTYIADIPASVTLSADPATVGAKSGSILLATVYDQYGNVTSGEPVIFSFVAGENNSGGALTPSAGNATTDTSGVATIVYTAGATAGVIDTLSVAVTNGAAPSKTVAINVISGEVPVPTKMIISSDVATIASDNSELATITVTLLDSINVVVPGATVTFSSDGGVLSTGAVVTDEFGEAVVTLRAGTDPTNQTITVTASNVDVAAQTVPVVVSGSTVQFTTTTTSQLTIGAVDTATLTLKAADSSGKGIYNVPLTVAIDSGSTATGVLDPAGTPTQTMTVNTDTNGLVSVTVQGGPTEGNLLLTAGALGASATKTLTVVTSLTSLDIVSPTDLTAVELNTPQTVTIKVPTGMTNVTLATSLGTWGTVNGVAVNSSSTTATGVAGTTFDATISSAESGTASVLVFDANNPSVSASIKILFVNSVVDANSKITLQAATTSVPVSTVDASYSVTLTGRVTDLSDNGIANAPVSLTMNNQPGGGEYIDPPYVFTDNDGVFSTTFYSGTIGSDSNGVDIIAELLGNGKTVSANVIISETAGSVVIGRSTTISSINDNTAYSLPMSVQIADANGSALPNVEVSLAVWPKHYFTGYWTDEGDVFHTGRFDNEDINRNLVLDTGEESTYTEGGFDINLDGDGYDVVGGDGILTPPNTASGTLPSSVITDENGVGTFNLVYLKANAEWINAEVTATVKAQGSESTGVLTFELPVLISDATGGHLPSSPYNRIADISVSPAEIGMGAEGVGAKSSVDIVAPSGQSVLTVKVVDVALNPVNAADVVLSFSSKGSGTPSLDFTTITTDVSGTAVATYTAGASAGLDVIKVQYGTFINYILINVQ